MIAPRRLLIGLYCASGAAALVYEVVWTRLLTLQLGHTVAAASTVLAAFMGGLALGAAAAGRFLSARRVSRVGQVGQEGPTHSTYSTYLTFYAALEIAIAACALALPFALRGTVPLLAWAYADGTAPLRFGLLRVAISLTLVGIPAAAMGATFPIAAQWLSSGRLQQSPASVLYAANTVGAALGALAAGFWLIPSVGLRATTWVGVALNVVAAAGALWLTRPRSEVAQDFSPAEPARLSPERRAKALRHKPPSPSHPSPSVRSTVLVPSPGLAWTAVAISGFSALVYEVAWTRLLALVIGPTTYAFSTMAAAFIAGLALGSATGTLLSRRVARPSVWLAWMLLAGAVASMTAAWYAASRLPFAVAAQVGDPAAAFSNIVGAQALAVGLLLLPSTMALGATFPLALAVAAMGEPTVARDAARVYVANTLGAILGALLAGFVLIPSLGLRSTFQFAAIVSALGGAACWIATKTRKHETKPFFVPSWFRGRSALLPGTVGAAAIAVIVALPRWDHELLASGAYKYAPYLQSADLETVLRAGTLEFYKEGAAGTVSVKRLTGVRSLAIDGKVDASNGADMLTQRLLGLLPVLLHGNARSVAIIGLGSGVTVGSALAPGTVQRADVIEISPEVVDASRFFDPESGHVLAQPAVRLIVGDGRSHLLLSPRRYDVIVSEPSNPWMAGVSALFTREFFEAARERLEPGGLLCQWAHTYDISPDDLKSIVRTFAEVFPQGTMWLVGEGDLLLIGARDGAIDARLAGLAAKCREGATPAALSTVGVDPAHAPFGLLSLYAGGPRDLVRYAGDARVQTDDGMALEYSAPRGIYGRSTGDNAADLRRLATELPGAVREALGSATDADWAARGAMLLRADAFGLAYEAFLRAATLNSRNAAALEGLSDTAAGAHREKDEYDWLMAAAAREPANAVIGAELAHLLASTGQYDQALQVATRAQENAPMDPRAAEQLASIFADAGDADRLAPLAERLIDRFPGRPDPIYYRATALFIRGRNEEAIAAVQPLLASNPDHARAQNLLGAACATLGRRDCARAAFDASLRANPRDSSTYVNAGTFALQNGDPQSAVNYFAEALSIDPTSDGARNGLAQARAQLSANPR
jgi:spermidine synthase